MPHIPPRAKATKEEGKGKKQQKPGKRTGEFEFLLQEQKELRREQRKRVRKWKRKCKRERRTLERERELVGEKNKEKEKELNRNQIYLSGAVTIVAAVVFNALYYKAGFSSSRDAHEKRAQSIRNLQERFWMFGCEKAEEVDSLADLWVDIMKARNTAAHQIEATNVIAVLPQCEPKLREVLERAFKFLWGISASDWTHATREQKSLTLRY